MPAVRSSVTCRWISNYFLGHICLGTDLFAGVSHLARSTLSSKGLRVAAFLVRVLPKTVRNSWHTVMIRFWNLGDPERWISERMSSLEGEVCNHGSKDPTLSIADFVWSTSLNWSSSVTRAERALEPADTGGKRLSRRSFHGVANFLKAYSCHKNVLCPWGR